ncbi:MAG TPA: NAD(P)-dependent alcohol dehydrogenase [Casimicrobiaceae bacterium]|nr:NAD(P)-dependent alcohol dehydrogenase [Casimicrobiaceae bacterium]
MRALRFDRYGGPEVLRVETMPELTPGAGEAKVRVQAVGLNPLDWKLRAGHMRYLPVFRPPPRGLGCDFAGEIVAIGGGATERHVGERVFGSLLPFPRDGALAEFAVAGYGRMSAAPAELDDVTLATLPVAGGTALQALTDDASVEPGERVLIIGAAGGVGHFAVQIAKHLGAHVVGVCSTSHVDFVRSIGADEVIDYTRSDFTRRADRFDVVFDAAGASTFAAAAPVLTERGRYLNTLGTASAAVNTIASAVLARVVSRRRAIPVALKGRPQLWQRLVDLVQRGAMHPHVSRVVPLEEVAEAQRAMQSGHARGKIVVRVAGSG